MIRYNIRVFAYVIVVPVIAIYLVFFFSHQDLSAIDWKTILSDVGTTVTACILLWTIFIMWGWKWKVFQGWLVQVPDLSGKWNGHVTFLEENENEHQIAIEVEIYQTFFNIQVKLKTEESYSATLAAAFDIEKDRGISRLFYSYENVPKASIQHRSTIHFGTTLLNFSGFEITELEGQYWTSRKTKGDVYLYKIN